MSETGAPSDHPLRAQLGAALPLAALALIAAVPPGTIGGRSREEPHQFLRTLAGFSASDLAALDGGAPVAKALDTDGREVAIVGAVRVKAPRERLFDQYRNVAGLRRSQVFMEVGTFSATPRAEDLRRLTFEDYDLDSIRECKPGDCGVRLPAAGLARFQHEVNWQAADWRQQAGSSWRRLLADYVGGYLAGGNKALAVYQNKDVPLSVAQEFEVLFDESRYFRPAAPELFRYLEEFPTVPLEGVEDILYWDKEVPWRRSSARPSSRSNKSASETKRLTAEPAEIAEDTKTFYHASLAVPRVPHDRQRPHPPDVAARD